MVDYTRRASRARILAGDMPDWIKNSKRYRYIAAVVISTPDWVDRAELQALKAKAAQTTEETGVLHVLDHIIPLSHPRVCGLTVPWNLRVVHYLVNHAKSNNWCPEQMELFDEAGA
jgi:hypothetical protein